MRLAQSDYHCIQDIHSTFSENKIQDLHIAGIIYNNNLLILSLWIGQKVVRQFFCCTFLMVLLMGWVFGVRRETFNTTTQFITVIVVTDITNIRYLPEKHTFLKGG